MDRPLRVGMLGAGNAARAHVASFRRQSDTHITALWSRSRPHAEQLATELDDPAITVFDRWDDLVGSGDIDILDIATPATFRRDPITAALDNGLHVLVEKPFTVDLPEAQELTQLAEQASSVTAVNLSWRYAPGTLAAKSAIEAGQIGTIFDLNHEWRIPVTADQFASALLSRDSRFVATRELGGGYLREAGSHEFDRIRFITGKEFERVTSQLVYSDPTHHDGLNGESQALVLAAFRPGGYGSFRMVITPSPPPIKQTIFYGEEGSLVMDDGAALLYRSASPEPRTVPLPAHDQAPTGQRLLHHTWDRLIADFITAVRNGDTEHTSVPRLPTFRDGLRTLEIITAAERAYATHRWIDLTDQPEE